MFTSTANLGRFSRKLRLITILPHYPFLWNYLLQTTGSLLTRQKRKSSTSSTRFAWYVFHTLIHICALFPHAHHKNTEIELCKYNCKYTNTNANQTASYIIPGRRPVVPWPRSHLHQLPLQQWPWNNQQVFQAQQFPYTIFSQQQLSPRIIIIG